MLEEMSLMPLFYSTLDLGIVQQRQRAEIRKILGVQKGMGVVVGIGVGEGRGKRNMKIHEC